MHKQYEEEPSRIEHEADATITLTIALHGPHAWEMALEDSRHYHSISHGWAADDPHGWEDAIAPVLRQFFGEQDVQAKSSLAQRDDEIVRWRLPCGPSLSTP
jgi:hypothetical protein